MVLVRHDLIDCSDFEAYPAAVSAGPRISSTNGTETSSNVHVWKLVAGDTRWRCARIWKAMGLGNGCGEQGQVLLCLNL